MARNPTRIPIVLQLLASLWEANADLRLGQLLTNIANTVEGDIWAMDDDRWELAIRLILSTGWSNQP